MVDAAPRTLRARRIVVCAVAAFDTLLVALFTYQRIGYDPSAVAPLGRPFTEIALATSAAVALVAFLRYAARRGRLAHGLLAFAASKICFALYARVHPTGHEDFVQAGASFLGWLLGAAFARAAGVDRGGAEPERAERWAATGFLALLACTYINAGMSKMIHSGGTWASSASLRLMVLAHYEYGMNDSLDPLRAWVAASPRFCGLLAAATLVVQLGAASLLGPRWLRRIWTVGLLGLHAGIYITSRILFFEVIAILATILLADLAWTWRRPPVATTAVGDPARAGRVLARGFAAALAVVVVGVAIRLGYPY
jgi:hypothetical protein